MEPNTWLKRYTSAWGRPTRDVQWMPIDNQALQAAQRSEITLWRMRGEREVTDATCVC